MSYEVNLFKTRLEKRYLIIKKHLANTDAMSEKLRRRKQKKQYFGGN